MEDTLARWESEKTAAYLSGAVASAERDPDKAKLFHELAKGLKLPEHFGNNFDALADSLEDRDWLGKSGCLIRLGHATHYRKTHPNDWSTLEEILSEACTFWRERNLAFWVLVN